MGPTNKQMALTATPPEQKPTVVVDAQIVAPTPLSVVELAIQRGASVDTLTKLFELQERLDARAAKKAFDAAFAAFQAEAPDLERTKEVSYGQGKTAYKYTPLDQITRAYRPVLAKHGLSFSWTQAQPAKDVISVTCTLKHVQGHSESCSLEGPPDNSGSKNAVQSISSGVSYLRRYTLLGVTGGATGDEDTDGMKWATPPTSSRILNPPATRTSLSGAIRTPSPLRSRRLMRTPSRLLRLPKTSGKRSWRHEQDGKARRVVDERNPQRCDLLLRQVRRPAHRRIQKPRQENGQAPGLRDLQVRAA